MAPSRRVQEELIFVLTYPLKIELRFFRYKRLRRAKKWSEEIIRSRGLERILRALLWESDCEPLLDEAMVIAMWIQK